MYHRLLGNCILQNGRHCRCSHERLWLFVLVVLVLSCGPVHQAIQLQADNIRDINRIAVSIPSEGAFTVLFDRATATPTPAVLFGLVGAAIASAHNASRDITKIDDLKPHLRDLSIRAAFISGFRQAIKESSSNIDIRIFEQPLNEIEVSKFDAVVAFDIKDWGLRLANRDAEQLAAFIELTATMTRSADGQTLWKANDTFLGQNRNFFSYYKDNGPVFRREMADTVANAGARMASKIIYPRSNN